MSSSGASPRQPAEAEGLSRAAKPSTSRPKKPHLLPGRSRSRDLGEAAPLRRHHFRLGGLDAGRLRLVDKGRIRLRASSGHDHRRVGRPPSDHSSGICGRTRTMVYKAGALHAGSDAGMFPKPRLPQGRAGQANAIRGHGSGGAQSARVFDPPGSEIDSGDFSDPRSGRMIFPRAARADDFNDAGLEKPRR
jgi:hypothetical protein